MYAYDLEQQIMDCWRILDDINTLHEEVIEGNLSKDQIANILLGVSTLYSIKFDKLFRTYEQLVHEKKLQVI